MDLKKPISVDQLTTEEKHIYDGLVDFLSKQPMQIYRVYSHTSVIVYPKNMTDEELNDYYYYGSVSTRQDSDLTFRLANGVSYDQAYIWVNNQEMLFSQVKSSEPFFFVFRGVLFDFTGK